MNRKHPGVSRRRHEAKRIASSWNDISSGKPRENRPDANHLPQAICSRFESKLGDLIDHLAETQGWRGKYLKSEYKTKYLDPDVVSPRERSDAAIEKWLLTDGRNASANQRLYIGDVDFGWATSDQILGFARKIVSDVLGELDLSKIFLSGSHTNGASTRIRRSPTAGVEKYAGGAHVTADARPYWEAYVVDTMLACQEVVEVDGSVLFTVPKSTEIDRVACKEPEINMFLQRSVGMHIRRRLRRFGVNLNDQTINQQLAKDALSLSLATVDLSSASDSISNQLVFSLLPFEWFSVLDAIRSKIVTIPESLGRHAGKIDVNMFSSMGNGFTFELESLIFWSLTRSIMYFSNVQGKVSVYGDDIICPISVARRLARVFHWFGFRTNARKSHWSGFFRESCGKHYHRGFDVTPFYLRAAIKTKTDIIRILNHLFLWDDPFSTGVIYTPEIADFHLEFSRFIPLRLHGGVDLNDPSCLVTGRKPRDRLVPIMEDCEYDGIPAMVSWFVDSEHRSETSERGFDPSSTCRYKYLPMPEGTVRARVAPWLYAAANTARLQP